MTNSSADFVADLADRFVRYVQIDTESDNTSSTVPSTRKQFDLLHLLRDELEALGARDARVLDSGFTLATIPATPGATAPRVGLLAHVDTTQQFTGAGVKPIIHRAYDGAPIVLPDDPTQVLSSDNSPYLKKKIGDDIVTASGTTLLGADDKAGVAILMTLAKTLLAQPEHRHGEIRLCFTTDEEIGTGIEHLDLDALDVDYAYTLDGAERGELTYESFSADKAVVIITGVSIHPGSAYGKMVNAQHLAAKLIMLLPKETRTPATTQDREGFIHLTDMQGSEAQARLAFILRDFEREGLAALGALLRQACAAVEATEPRARITCTITPQYRNMRYWIEDDMRPVDVATRAMQAVGIAPDSTPIRGGTDGSKLTERGLLTPNLFTGMQNVHGPLEWVSLEDMAEAVAVCLALVEEWAQPEADAVPAAEPATAC